MDGHESVGEVGGSFNHGEPRKSDTSSSYDEDVVIDQDLAEVETVGYGANENKTFADKDHAYISTKHDGIAASSSNFQPPVPVEYASLEHPWDYEAELGEEAEVLREIFDMCDVDKDGICDLDEIRTAYEHALPDSVKDSESHGELMRVLDSQASSQGGVDFDEFKHGCVPWMVVSHL